MRARRPRVPGAAGSRGNRPGDVIPLGEATRAWFAISLQTFGGPAGQIAVMQHQLVDEKRWIGQRRFLHALNYCMLLPGPEAQQLAIYTGLLLNGTLGGLIAGILFVLPGMLALLGLTILYLAAGSSAVVTGLFAGLAPAVIVIVVQAVYRVGKRALTHRVLVVLAVASFLALAVFGAPFPVVIIAAGIVALGLLVWFAPVLLAGALLGRGSIYVDQGLFFSGAAVITFGGAYVLAYVAQQAVEVYGWLAPGEMVHGLALAETTPGPLVMVTQWVGGVAAYRDPGSLDPWTGMLVGSLLTTWVTFVPCFLFVFLGAPYVERLRHNTQLTATLTGITAAVMGVIASLAVYFSLHTLFDEARAVDTGPFHLERPSSTPGTRSRSR